MEDSAVSCRKLRQKHFEQSLFPAIRDQIRDMTVRMIRTLCPRGELRCLAKTDSPFFIRL